MNVRKILAAILMTLFVGGIVIGVFTVFFFTLGGLFVVLGVHFETYWSLLFFFILLFVIGFFTEILFKGFMLFAFTYVRNKWEAMAVQGLVSFADNLIVLFIVDWIVASVTLTLQAKIIVVIFLVFVELIVDKEWKKAEEKAE